MDFINMFSLKGKNALVTGASYGIGFGIAKTLSNTGATIISDDVIKESVKKGLTTYKGNSINAHGYLFNITDEQSVRENIKKVGSDVGIIDTLVNNAGIIQRKPMLKTTTTGYRKITDIDLTGQFIMAKAALLSMIKKGHGKVISVCSMMSELGHKTVVGYASAKGSLKMLTRNVCSEFGEKNIQCNGIGPGCIATPQTVPLCEVQSDGSCHPFDQFIISKTPAGHWGKPDDLTGAAILLVLDAPGFIDGHILYVNGDILAYTGE